MNYSSEDELTKDFISALDGPENPWGKVAHMLEFGYVRGRTDVVAIDGFGHILAFELKLRKWKDAAHQAYRNTCFANSSYVVLPERTAETAIRHRYEFILRGIGLCYIAGESIHVVAPAVHQTPVQPCLSEIATSAVLKAS